MFDFLKNMFKKREPEKEQEPEVFDPGITISISAEGKIVADCFWPTPSNDDSFELIVTRLSSLLFLLNEGKLYPIIQQSLGSGVTGGDNDMVAQRVLHAMNIEMNHKNKQALLAKLSPCVPPTAAFDPKPDGLPLN